MSLTSKNSKVFLTFVCAAGLFTWSCGKTEQGSPLAPSAMSSPGAQYDDAGATDEPGAPTPGQDPQPPAGGGGTPAPAPSPTPQPTNPDDEFFPPPTPAPPAPGQLPTPVPTRPTYSGDVMAKVDPNPVPYSGRPVPLFSCRDNPHTWYYEQTLYSNTGGHSYTFTERENFFDGRFVSRIGETLTLAPNGSVKFSSRWCSAYPEFHYAQTRFKGKDEAGNPVVVNGPIVRLQPR